MIKHLRYLVLALFVAAMGFAAFSVSSHLFMPIAYKAAIEKAAPVVIPKEPTGGSVPKPAPSLPQAKVEIPGLVNIEISEGHSWATIAKLMVIILGTFLGIRAINTVFARLTPAS